MCSYVTCSASSIKFVSRCTVLLWSRHWNIVPKVIPSVTARLQSVYGDFPDYIISGILLPQLYCWVSGCC